MASIKSRSYLGVTGFPDSFWTLSDGRKILLDCSIHIPPGVNLIMEPTEFEDGEEIAEEKDRP